MSASPGSSHAPSRSLRSAAAIALVGSVVVAFVGFVCLVIIKAFSVIVVFFGAIIFGEVLRPVVGRLAKHVSRSVAIVFVLGVLGLAAAGLIAFAIRTLRSQLSLASALLSRHATEITGLLEGWFGPGVRDGFMRFVAGNAAPIAIGFLQAQESVAAAISTALLVVLVTAFWLASSDALGASLLGFVAPRLRCEVRSLCAQMGSTLGSYAGGVLLNGSIVALGSTVILAILHAPAPLVFGLFQGLLVAIPYVGTLVAVLTAGGVVLAAHGLQSALAAIALLSIMECTEGSFISPLIFKKRLNLNPLTTLFASAAGGALLGLQGVVLAIPVAALLQTVLDHGFARASPGRVSSDGRTETTDAGSEACPAVAANGSAIGSATRRKT